jgi:dynein heavy chain, axonemal
MFYHLYTTTAAAITTVQVSLLNFTITLSGLEDQLLNAVLTEELPELATAKEQLALSGAAMVAELYGIESNILRLLSESEGNILDNTALIETLAEAKVRLVLHVAEPLYVAL